MRRGPFSVQSGANIGLPHWAQGFSWGKPESSRTIRISLFAVFCKQAGGKRDPSLAECVGWGWGRYQVTPGHRVTLLCDAFSGWSFQGFFDLIKVPKEGDG
jgi:hypothetical protein